MKRILFFIWVFCAFEAYAQNISNPYRLGVYFDSKGEMIDGYYDFDTEFKQFFKQKYIVGSDFSSGYFYDQEHKKITGGIRYSQQNASFHFRFNENSDIYVIDPALCSSFVIGADSFTVIQDFKTRIDQEIVTITQKEFVQVIDRIGDFTFYKHVNKSIYNPSATNAAKTSYIVKADHWDSYKTFYDKGVKNKALWDTVFTALAGRPYLTVKGLKEDAPSIIKKLKYIYKAGQQQKIFFNICWDEAEDSAASAFYARITSKGDTIFHLAYYFHDNTPMCEGDFISFYPHKKSGEFSWYYADGSIRKKVLYDKNVAVNSYTYHPGGKIHYEYRTHKKKRYYTKVFSDKGAAILDSTGSGTEIYFDAVLNQQITFEYQKHRLVSAYYLTEGGGKIFKYVKKTAHLIEFPAVQAEFKDYKSFPVLSALNNQHGITLVKLIVEPTGYVSDIKIIKSTDASSDTLIHQFFPIFRKNILWHVAAYHRKKVRQEVVVPVEFAICGFSRYRSNSQYYNSWSFQLKSTLETQRDMISMPKINLSQIGIE